MKSSVDPKSKDSNTQRLKESKKKTHIIRLESPFLFGLISWEQPDSLSYQLKRIIFHAVKEVAEKEKIEFSDIQLEHPQKENYGDYATNIALIMSGRLKIKPMDLAEKLKERISEYIREGQTLAVLSDKKNYKDIDLRVKDVLERAETARPGFLNLWLTKGHLVTHLTKLLDFSEKDTTRQKIKSVKNLPLSGKKIMVEFADPNPFKEFHIGHLRNISLGECFCRLFESLGGQVRRVSYQGDVGMHVAKSIWGLRKVLKEDKSIELKALEPRKIASILGKAYTVGSQFFEKDDEAKKEITKLNVGIYRNDSKILEEWKDGRKMSLDYFDIIYQRVGTKYTRFYFESEVAPLGVKIVNDYLKKGIFEESDDAIVFRGEKEGLHTRVFVTKDNYATYEAKDLSLAILKYKEYPYDISIILTGTDHIEYFRVTLAALSKIDKDLAEKTYNSTFGMVNLTSGKMASRIGNVVTADWLIDEAKSRIKERVKQSSDQAIKQINKPGLSSYSKPGLGLGLGLGELDEIAEKVAVAAVKYSMLRVNPKMDIAFDIEKSVSLEGDSGPYLLYSYARCRSVLRKAQDDKDTKIQRYKDTNKQIRKEENVQRNFEALHLGSFELNSEELSLLRAFYRFEEAVLESTKTFSPNLLCSYLYDLASKYNLFYNKHSILHSENRKQKTENRELESDKDTSGVTRPVRRSLGEGGRGSPDGGGVTKAFRLALTSTTAQIIKKGLYLLGIATVERM